MHEYMHTQAASTGLLVFHYLLQEKWYINTDQFLHCIYTVVGLLVLVQYKYSAKAGQYLYTIIPVHACMPNLHPHIFLLLSYIHMYICTCGFPMNNDVVSTRICYILYACTYVTITHSHSTLYHTD